jgi:hypothetical protein
LCRASVGRLVDARARRPPAAADSPHDVRALSRNAKRSPLRLDPLVDAD